MQMPPSNKRKGRTSPEPQIQRPSPQHDRDVPSSTSAADNLSSPFTNPLVLPPGYRFLPTEEELILAYLIPYLQGSEHSWPDVPVHHVNIYESNPEQLTEKFKKGNEKEWFFISERSKTHKGGKNYNRSDSGGYWHAKDGAKKINLGQDLVGYKTALDHYVGKQPNGVKTNWLMTEYSFDQYSHANEKVDHALYKIYLNPSGVKKKRLEEKENKNQKKEESVATVELEEKVEQPHYVEYEVPYHPQLLPATVDSHQPHSYNTAYQQPQQGTTIFPPPPQGFGTLMTTQNNDFNNNMLMSSQENLLDMCDGAYLDVEEFTGDVENMMLMYSQEDNALSDIKEFFNDLDNGKYVTQQQQP